LENLVTEINQRRHFLKVTTDLYDIGYGSLIKFSLRVNVFDDIIVLLTFLFSWLMPCRSETIQLCLVDCYLRNA